MDVKWTSKQPSCNNKLKQITPDNHHIKQDEGDAYKDHRQQRDQRSALDFLHLVHQLRAWYTEITAQKFFGSMITVIMVAIDDDFKTNTVR